MSTHAARKRCCIIFLTSYSSKSIMCTMSKKNVRVCGVVDVLHFDDTGDVFRKTTQRLFPAQKKQNPRKAGRHFFFQALSKQPYHDIDSEILQRRMQSRTVRVILKEEYLNQKQGAVHPERFPPFTIWKALVAPGDSRISDDERQRALHEYCQMK